MEKTERKWTGRYDWDAPKKIAVFRSRDLTSSCVNSHKEVIVMGYVDTVEEYEAYVNYEYPNAVKKESHGVRGAGDHYYSDGDYNIFYHTFDKLKTGP